MHFCALHSFMEDVEIRANIDKAVDALLPSIRKFILKNGMDPLKLIDISEYIFPNLVRKNKTNNKIFISVFLKFYKK